MTVSNVAVDTIIDPNWGNEVADNINDLITDLAALQASFGTEQGFIDTLQAAVGAIEANNWVTAARILAGAVTTAKLADLAVTDPKIANGTITEGKLATAVLSSAWSSYASGNFSGESFVTQRQGNVVHLHFQGTVSGSGTAVTTISTVAHRPAYNVFLPGINVSTGAAVPLAVNADGSVTTVGTLTPGHVVAWSGVYPAA